MEWLNFHHLRYFWTVARKGGVRKAADELHVSQPSISAQLRLLEDSLGEKLFKRSGRNLVLTEMGQLVLTYADEIFSAGRELMNAVKQRPGGRLLRLNVGMTDSISKLMGFEFLKPAIRFSEPVHVVCRMAAIEVLVNQLQAHRLDIVLADEPASSSLKAKTFNHRLGRSGVTFCAVPAIAKKLRRNFPQSLNGATALLPTENMGMRAVLETWFDTKGIHPRLLGEVRGLRADGFLCHGRTRLYGRAYRGCSRSPETLGPESYRECRRVRDGILCDHRRAASEKPGSYGHHGTCIFGVICLNAEPSLSRAA